MAPSKQSITQGSMILKAWTLIRTKSNEWAEQAQTVTLARRLLTEDVARSSTDVGNNPDQIIETESSPTVSDSETQVPSDIDEKSATVQTGIQSTSVVYRGVRRISRFTEASWLYQWLTTEPESEVIVINLRETLSVRPILTRTERMIRNTISVMPTSGGLRFGYQLRDRFFSQPIRILSIGLIGVVLIAFLGLATTGESIGLSTFVLFAVLLLAVHGTQSTQSWDRLTDTWWYKTVALAFKPPENTEKN